MFGIDIQVRYSETDSAGRVSLHQILDYFQDTGTFQSLSLGLYVGGAFEEGKAWYLLAWDLNVVRYPVLGEHLHAITEPYKMKGFYGYRRFYLRDEEDQLVAYADSIWVFMDVVRMLPERISDELRSAFMGDQEDQPAAMKRKLPVKGDWTETETIEVSSIFLDTNQHVNNTYYVQWAESLVPEDFRVSRLKVDYRQSAFKGDRIRVYCDRKDDLFRVRYVNQDEVLIALCDMHLIKNQ